jgi:membrane-associated protein
MALVDFILHFDRYLLQFVADYGSWVYAILFAIVFAETGVVVTPFLPGDSLLFATGAVCATGALSTPIAATLLTVAAIAGDGVNYAVGRYIGPKIIAGADRSALSHRLLNQQHIDRAHAFFEKYGGKAVVLGRFVPIVRTFVPFVAGAAGMNYAAFAFYNVTGAIAWVGICLGAGWMFGNVPIVKDNFSLVTIGIVFVSVLPMVVEFVRSRRADRRAPVPPRA